MHAVWTPPVPPHAQAGHAGYGPSAFANAFPRSLDAETNRVGGPSSTQQRPMRSRPPPAQLPSQQTIYSDDPAFSSDPSENPDFFQGLSREDVRIAIPSHTPVENGKPVCPPSYDEAVPEASPTFPSTAGSPYSEAPLASVASRPGTSEVDSQDEQEELLAYLQDDWTDDAQETHQMRNIPQALRPGRSATAQQLNVPPLVLSQERMDVHGKSMSTNEAPLAVSREIVRSATAPPSSSRPDAFNGLSSGTGRPQLQRRIHTGSPMRPSDLDRIDELDESVPQGAQFHMRGPYEVGKVDEPPSRFAPWDRPQPHQGALRQHILHAEDPPDIPPAPVPFKLHLKPGEFLTRVPSTTNRKPVVPTARPNPPALLHSQAPASQGVSRTLRNGANELANPAFHLQNQEQNYDWTPEQLYHEQAVGRPTPNQRSENVRQYTGGWLPPKSNSSSVNSSRTDLSLQMPDGLRKGRGLPPPEERRAAPYDQIVASGQSALSRSTSTPVASKPASFSSSTSSLVRGPPPSDRHRPRQIVLPAPLRQQNPNQSFTTYTAPSTIVPSAKPQPATAAVIPMHDAKKGNLLKKRASTNTPPQYLIPPPPPQSAPARKSSTSKGLFRFSSGASNRSSTTLDESGPKASRKLSKRRV